METHIQRCISLLLWGEVLNEMPMATRATPKVVSALIDRFSWLTACLEGVEIVCLYNIHNSYALSFRFVIYLHYPLVFAGAHPVQEISNWHASQMSSFLTRVSGCIKYDDTIMLSVPPKLLSEVSINTSSTLRAGRNARSIFKRSTTVFDFKVFLFLDQESYSG